VDVIYLSEVNNVKPVI